jgi:hypothetical protein
MYKTRKWKKKKIPDKVGNGLSITPPSDMRRPPLEVSRSRKSKFVGVSEPSPKPTLKN